MPNTDKPNGVIELGNLRQQKAALQISELLRSKKKLTNVTLGKILAKAGYSESVQKSPSLVVRSDSFQKLLDKYIPEKILTKKHKNLLNAANVLDQFIFSNTMTDKEIKAVIEKVPGCVFIKTQRNSQWARAYFYKPDNGTQFKALELGYKVHKKMANSNGSGGEEGLSGEIREVVFRIKKILPSAGM